MSFSHALSCRNAFFSENHFVYHILHHLALVSWLLWHSTECFCLFVYLVIKWSKSTDGFYHLLSEHVPWSLSVHLCHLLLKQSFIYWDVLIMYYTPLWCLHSWLFPTIPCPLALKGSLWFITYGYMDVHKAFRSFFLSFCSFIVCEILLQSSFIVCVKVCPHCLLCTKNGNFCDRNIILGAAG